MARTRGTVLSNETCLFELFPGNPIQLEFWSGENVLGVFSREVADNVAIAAAIP